MCLSGAGQSATRGSCSSGPKPGPAGGRAGHLQPKVSAAQRVAFRFLKSTQMPQLEGCPHCQPQTAPDNHSSPSVLEGDLVQGRRHQRSATGQSPVSTAAALHTHTHARTQQDPHHVAAVSHSAPDSPPYVLLFFYTCMKSFYYKEVSGMSPRQNLGRGNPIPSSSLVRWPGPARSSLGPQSWALAFRAALCFPVISLGNGTSPGQGTCPSTSQMHSRRQYFRGPKLAG